MKRENWASRSAFIFAAIGSAVGLGNAWRFAGKAYENGGGSFLIPYIIAMACIGVPILILEISFGKKYQLGAPSAFGAVNKKLEWIGWMGIIICFFIVSYYTVIVSWVLNYIIASFTLAWGGDPASFFYNNVLMLSSGPGDVSGVSIPVIIGLAITWGIVILCMYKGLNIMAKIVKWIVIAPIAILIIMCIFTLQAPGAMEGVQYFLTPHWEVLAQPSVWTGALGQVSYSMSILFAIMITYGSFLPKNSNVAKDALIIGGADLGISMLAGTVVFGALGLLSTSTGVAIGDMSYQGVSLAFITYPQALAAFPGGPVVASIIGLLFFLVLFMLAIDSVFSIVLPISTAFSDKFKINPKKTLLFTCLAGFLMGLLYVTNAGLYWLDIVDHFFNEFSLLLMGIFEAIALGWLLGADKLRTFIWENKEARIGKVWAFIIKFVAPVVFLFLSGSFLVDNILSPYGGYEQQWLFVGGWLLIIVTFVVALLLPKLKTRKMREETPSAPQGQA